MQKKKRKKKEKELEDYLIPYTEINPKWIKYLNMRPKAIKFLEENMCSMFFDIGLSNIFQGMSPQAKEQKQK